MSTRARLGPARSIVSPCWVSALILLGGAIRPALTQQDPPALASLSFLAGCWAQEGDGLREHFEEGVLVAAIEGERHGDTSHGRAGRPRPLSIRTLAVRR